MNPIEYIENNPRISGQASTGLITVISIILSVLNINPELAEPLAVIAGGLMLLFSQSRTNYWKNNYEEITEPDMNLPDTPEEDLTLDDYVFGEDWNDK